MNDNPGDVVDPSDVARSLARVWEGARQRLEARGVATAEIGKSLVATGLVAWIEAEGAAKVAEACETAAADIRANVILPSH